MPVQSCCLPPRPGPKRYTVERDEQTGQWHIIETAGGKRHIVATCPGEAPAVAVALLLERQWRAAAPQASEIEFGKAHLN